MAKLGLAKLSIISWLLCIELYLFLGVESHPPVWCRGCRSWWKKPKDMGESEVMVGKSAGGAVPVVPWARRAPYTLDQYKVQNSKTRPLPSWVKDVGVNQDAMKKVSGTKIDTRTYRVRSKSCKPFIKASRQIQKGEFELAYTQNFGPSPWCPVVEHQTSFIKLAYLNGINHDNLCKFIKVVHTKTKDNKNRNTWATEMNNYLTLLIKRDKLIPNCKLD